MKKILLFVFAIVVLVSVSGIVIGQEDKPVKAGDGSGGAKRSIRPKGRDQGPRGSSQLRDRGSRGGSGREMIVARQTERMEADIKRATKAHGEFAAELLAIKKLAEEEGAKKTSAKIQELIDKDKKKLEKQTAGMKKRMEEYMKRIQGGPRSPDGGRGVDGRRSPTGGRDGQGRGGARQSRGGAKGATDTVEKK